jgi:FkbH-like protein
MNDRHVAGNPLSDPSPAGGSSAQGRSDRKLVLAATFAIEPIEQPLQFWIETLCLPLDVQLAPHGQVLQQLLDPSSFFSGNRTGINILFLRPEDCARDLPASIGHADYCAHVERTVQEWIHAVTTFRAKSTASLIVFVPPASRSAEKFDSADLEAIRGGLERALQAAADVTFLQHCDIEELYPVDTSIDDETDQIANVPFTTDYFVAMATLLIRTAVRLLAPPSKVIVLDCDNTLWDGACGESSPRELQLSAHHIAFQKMLVERQEMGVMLCLCSKNNLADVEAVFASRPDMPLRFDHIIAHKINWEAKSANLSSLAAELKLGLDSFIFIDDNPVECAEVTARCPEVLTLQVPVDPGEFHTFIKHTWAFDITDVTAEARKRAAYYRQNQLREAAMAEARDFGSFLAGLGLSVSVRPLQPEHLERAAELVVRTNQFNLTTIRRLPGEISALARDDSFHVLTVSVSDRFGEYGLTGLVFLLVNGTTAEVDTFLLSCRVLGRGVEAAVVNHLGLWASERGLAHVQFEYRRTGRNAPALQFLRRAFGQFEVNTVSGALYKVPVPYASVTASHCTAHPGSNPGSDDSSNSTVNLQIQPVSHRWNVATQSLTRVPDITREIRRRYPRRNQIRDCSEYQRIQDANGSEHQGPVGNVEESLAQLWQDLLGTGPMDRNAGFIELGGDSVLAVQLTSRIAKRWGVRPSLAAIMRCHSLAAMAQLITALRPVSATEWCIEIEEGSI